MSLTTYNVSDDWGWYVDIENNNSIKLETYQYKFNNFNQTEYLKKGNLEEMIMYYEYYFKNKYVNTEGMFKVGSVTFILTYILWFVL